MYHNKCKDAPKAKDTRPQSLGVLVMRTIVIVLVALLALCKGLGIAHDSMVHAIAHQAQQIELATRN